MLFRSFLRDMKESGIGVGALIQSYEHIYIVKSINWDAVTSDNRYSYALGVSPLNNLDSFHTMNFPSHFGATEESKEYYKQIAGRDVKAVNPVSVESIEKSVPKDWLNGISQDHMPMHLK